MLLKNGYDRIAQKALNSTKITKLHKSKKLLEKYPITDWVEPRSTEKTQRKYVKHTKNVKRHMQFMTRVECLSDFVCVLGYNKAFRFLG